MKKLTTLAIAAAALAATFGLTGSANAWTYYDTGTVVIYHPAHHVHYVPPMYCPPSH